MWVEIAIEMQLLSFRSCFDEVKLMKENASKPHE